MFRGPGDVSSDRGGCKDRRRVAGQRHAGLSFTPAVSAVQLFRKGIDAQNTMTSPPIGSDGRPPARIKGKYRHLGS